MREMYQKINSKLTKISKDGIRKIYQKTSADSWSQVVELWQSIGGEIEEVDLGALTVEITKDEFVACTDVAALQTLLLSKFPNCDVSNLSDAYVVSDSTKGLLFCRSSVDSNYTAENCCFSFTATRLLSMEMIFYTSAISSRRIMLRINNYVPTYSYNFIFGANKGQYVSFDKIVCSSTVGNFVSGVNNVVIDEFPCCPSDKQTYYWWQPKTSSITVDYIYLQYLKMVFE